MAKIKKKLGIGQHVLPIPSGSEVPLKTLFPKEVAGSTIEKMTADGVWLSPETIYYENHTLVTSDNCSVLKPLEIMRLHLKREITIEWDIDFTSHSGLGESGEIDFTFGFDYDKALYLAQLSTLVYDEPQQIENSISKYYDFDSFRYYSRQSHKGLLKKGVMKALLTFFRGKRNVIDLQFMHLTKIDENTGEKRIVVVFRGSQEPQDWMTNFTFFNEDFNQKGKVHSGFNQAIKLFFKTIKEEDFTKKQIANKVLKHHKNADSNTKIILTGHSLGGALATLAACYLRETGFDKENIEVYTFGAPPVGTDMFCNYYKDKLNIYRIVNENDVVPKLEKITNLFHLGDEIVLPSNEGEVHACSGYIDNLIDALQGR